MLSGVLAEFASGAHGAQAQSSCGLYRAWSNWSMSEQATAVEEGRRPIMRIEVEFLRGTAYVRIA